MQPLEHARRHRAGDLEPDRVAEAAPVQLELDRLEQVVGLVGDLEVGVARDAEDAALGDLHLREQPVEEVARSRSRAAGTRPRLPSGRKRGSTSGTFTRANRSSPVFGSRDVDAEAQRQPGDVGERLARADRRAASASGRSAVEDVLELRALGLRAVLDAPDHDAGLREPRPQVALPDARLARGQLEDALPDLGQRLGAASGRRASGRRGPPPPAP